MTESLRNLGFFGNNKAKIPKFDEKNKIWGEKLSVGDPGNNFIYTILTQLIKEYKYMLYVQN